MNALWMGSLSTRNTFPLYLCLSDMKVFLHISLHALDCANIRILNYRFNCKIVYTKVNLLVSDLVKCLNILKDDSVFEHDILHVLVPP